MFQNKIQTFKARPQVGYPVSMLLFFFVLHYEKIKRREQKPKNKMLVSHLEDTVGAKT